MDGTKGKSYLRLTVDPGVRGPVTREDVGYFFINSFLLSRIDSDMPSDLAEYDEDVNVYTASLLAGVVSGREDLLRADLVSTRDADVFARVQESKDRRLRYQVYKANADFLYVSLGVFAEGVVPREPVAASEADAQRLTGRGKSYYHFASAYAERLYGSRAGIAEVMEKLSRNFEAYTKVMSWMSGEYLNLVRRLSEGEVFHIERDAQSRFEDAHKSNTWDELLDAYVEWQKSHAVQARRRLTRAARELKRIDPQFSFRAFREKWGSPRRT
ncbi:MAG TPA: hypothetical protein VF363_10240 [Candidatus Eisenbacteria bacterium]